VRKEALDAPAITLLLVMCMCLAVGHVAIKVANAGISPLWQAGLRSVGAAAFLALISALRGSRILTLDRTFWPGLATAVLFTLEFALLYPGLQYTTAAHAVILLYTSPFVVAVGAHFLIPGDRLTTTKVVGLVLAFAGVASVVLGREAAAGNASGGPTLFGDLLCLGGALAWGGLTLVIRTTSLKHVAPEKVTFLQLMLSAPMLLALAVAMGEPGLTNPTQLHWAAFGFTVVFVAGFVFTSTNWLLLRYPASRVMAFLLVTPVLGVIAAHLLLGEVLAPNLLLGLSMVVAGLWFVNRPARQR
jgi:drug/metabolite transporter (DMT)-like permease